MQESKFKIPSTIILSNRQQPIDAKVHDKTNNNLKVNRKYTFANVMKSIDRKIRDIKDETNEWRRLIDIKWSPVWGGANVLHVFSIKSSLRNETLPLSVRLNALFCMHHVLGFIHNKI